MLTKNLLYAEDQNFYPIQDWELFFLNRKISYEVFDDEGLDDYDFDEVDILILPSIEILSDDGFENLQDFLEEGKGLFFFLALGFHIQDLSGHFTLTLGTVIIGPFHVWFLLFIMYGVERWIALMSVWSNVILEEPRIVSFGNVYIVWVFLIFNILDWFLVLYTIGVILVAIWTLIEKTFNIFPPKTLAKE